METRKRKRRNREEQTEIRGLRALPSLFGGPCCMAGVWPLLACLALGLLEKTVVGRRACKETVGSEAVRDGEGQAWSRQMTEGVLDLWEGLGAGGSCPEAKPHCDVGRGVPQVTGALPSPDWPKMARHVLVSGPFRAPPASTVLWSRLNLQ